MRKRKLTILCQIGWLLIFALHCWADAPVEQYYFKLSEIPPSVLMDAKGALAILSQDPPYMRKYHGKQVERVRIRAFQKKKDGFRETVTIDLERTQPLSGWLFDGTRVRRYPVVERDGEYLKIVHDVKSNLRTWIHTKDVAHLMPKGWGSSVRLAWFTGRSVRDETGVDVFRILTQKKRRLYQVPTVCSIWRTVLSESDLQGTGRGMWTGNLIITEQRDGFARLAVRDPCDEKALRHLGWILLRDDKGRLTVWPDVGLSC